MSNSVKLYSNGTAEVCEEHSIDGPKKISIPVKQEALDEVIASLDFFGDGEGVKMPEPPSYTPVGTKTSVLQLSANNITKDLATKLVGADVQVIGPENLSGRLLGIQEYMQYTAQGNIPRFNIGVLLDGGEVKQLPENEVRGLKFTSPEIQSEIDKALKNALQKIKPNSTFVEFTIAPIGGRTNARVQYCVPGAAWKMRYHLRRERDVWEIAGHAVVDNFTDSDWRDVIVSVITGQPIAFDTDLTEVRRPKRAKVKLVADQTLGNVQASDEMPQEAMLESLGFAERGSSMRMARTSSLRSKGGGMEGGMVMCASAAPSQDEDYFMPTRGVESSADVRDIGDFSEFTAKDPVTIKANTQALIPMFTQTFEGKPVLLYKEKDDAQRPWNAVRVKNTTSLSLASGVVEVFMDGANIGKDTFKALKPGEESLVVHALETGVKVFKVAKPMETKQVGIKLKEWLTTLQTSYKNVTSYRVKNNKPEAFKLEIEHNRGSYSNANTKYELQSSVGEATKVEIPTGIRVGVDLPSNGEVTVTVVENTIHAQTFTLDENNGPSWIVQNIVSIKHPLARREGIRKLVELQDQLEELQESETELETENSDLEREQERLLKMIDKGHSADTDRWKTKLGKAEDKLDKNNKETLPPLREKIRAAQNEVKAAFAKLAFDWNEGTTTSEESGK